jgi:hypothetical protein
VGAVRSALDWIAAQGAHGNAEPVIIFGWSTGHRQRGLRAVEGLNLVFSIPEPGVEPAEKPHRAEQIRKMWRPTVRCLAIGGVWIYQPSPRSISHVAKRNGPE